MEPPMPFNISPALVAAVTASLLLSSSVGLAAEPGFAAEANGLCRASINARDPSLFRAAQEETVAILARQMRDRQPPDPETAQRLTALLEAVNRDIAALVDGLAALAPAGDEEAEALGLYLDYAEAEMTVRLVRIGFLGDLEHWQWPNIHDLGVDFPDNDAYLAALEQLGFQDRDCQHALSSPGNPPEGAAFIAAVAPVCAAIVDRRLGNGFEAWRALGVEAVLTAFQDEAFDPAAAPALRAMARDWVTAESELSQIDAALAPDAQIWLQALADIRERAVLLERRADIIAGNDASPPDEVFRVRASLPEFETLGLGETSCMALLRHF